MSQKGFGYDYDLHSGYDSAYVMEASRIFPVWKPEGAEGAQLEGTGKAMEGMGTFQPA